MKRYVLTHSLTHRLALPPARSPRTDRAFFFLKLRYAKTGRDGTTDGDRCTAPGQPHILGEETEEVAGCCKEVRKEGRESVVSQSVTHNEWEGESHRSPRRARDSI